MHTFIYNTCKFGVAVLNRSRFTPDEYREKNITLYKHYYPIEICHELTIEEKIPHMINWCAQYQKNFVESGYTQESIKEMVANSTCTLRFS